jgi:hypothetical protein
MLHWFDSMGDGAVHLPRGTCWVRAQASERRGRRAHSGHVGLWTT